MAQSQPNPPWVRVDMFYRIAAQECLNVFWYDCASGTGSIAQADAIGQQFAATIGVGFTACVSNQVTLSGFGVSIRTTTDLYEAFVASTDTGDLMGEALPAQDAIVFVKGYSVTPGQRITRGRWFFSGQSEDQAEGGFITPASSLNWQVLADALQDTLVAGGETYTPQVFRSSLLSLAPITLVTFDTIVKTLRSRRPLS